MQIINTLTVFALVVMSFALIVAVPVLYASSEDSGRSNRLILLGSGAWVALVLLNWGVSFFCGLNGGGSDSEDIRCDDGYIAPARPWPHWKDVSLIRQICGLP